MPNEVAEESAIDATVAAKPADFDPVNPQGDQADASQEEARDEVSEEQATAEDSAEPSESSTENEDGEVPPERIKEVTKKYRDQERQTNYWKERALAAEKDQEPAPEGPKLEKTLEDFDYDVAKYTQYVSEEVTKAYEQNQQAAQARQDQNQVLESHLRREAEFSATVEDYSSVALRQDLPVSPLMADIIRRSDDGPAVLYHLGQNPETSAKIYNLPPQLQVMEMGRIAERIASTAKPETSKAPAPPAQLSGKKPAKRITASDPESDNLSDEEWLKRRKKEIYG